jgi:hypothetical protein
MEKESGISNCGKPFCHLLRGTEENNENHLSK